MYLIGCYVITGKLGNFSWLSCVYCYIITIIRFYSADGVWLAGVYPAIFGLALFEAYKIWPAPKIKCSMLNRIL